MQENKPNFVCVPYGSQVYGTYNPGQSDKDFICVWYNYQRIIDGINFTNALGSDIDITIYSRDIFQCYLNEHNPFAVETYFYAKNNPVKKIELPDIEFKLNLPSLRKEFSHVASNSWVKAKKKILQKDFYLGCKSMFHSLRILMFGIELAETGEIKNFSVANGYFHGIFQLFKKWQYEMTKKTVNSWFFCPSEAEEVDVVFLWNQLKDVNQPIYNRLASKFRQLAPKQ